MELKSITAGDVIGNLARKLDLNFHEIAREPEDESKDQQGLIKVPIELLEKIIASLIPIRLFYNINVV